MLYLAGIIVFLHTVMPHSHCDAMPNVVQVSSDYSTGTFLGHIKMMLNTDMGEGHLEHFQSGNGPDLDMSNFISPAILLAVISEHVYLNANKHITLTTKFYLKNDPIPDPSPRTSVSRRGPPSIS